ncbi:putative calcium calmodulin-dependent protein kinase type 2 beta chain [Diplodia seriata]|uniref:Putative calcium calmodulin-dependent protein kinase type 2 beta chain n=1 Tax=Diplodia seriata TaxID=420778 RepID=A0A0G2EJ21_9PEZI|nr:putative calcium calmodulin-dependent protein kinase type 2 beta chain [Diplodia seriata]
MLINQGDGSKKPRRRGIKRLLTEWVPHGHLAAFLNYYLESGHLVPEPFIWYCFKVLTEVALVCWNGQASATMAPGWEHIVNTDIKPDNVWLGAPDPTEPMEWARRYPQPKVGDFGMAYRTHHGLDDRNNEDPQRRRVNPPDFQGWGTRGHMPPEMFYRNAKDNLHYGHNPARAQQTVDRLNAILPHTPLPWPNPWPADVPPDNSGVHSWTMVWEIGMIIWCMLATMAYGSRGVGQGKDYNLDIIVDFSGGPRHDLPPRMESGGNPLRPAYSGRLVELAFRCLEVLPTDRIDLADLWKEVCEGCDDVGAQFVDANGNRTWPNPVTYVPDKYPLGQNVLNDYYT